MEETECPYRPSNPSSCQSCPGKHRSVSAAPCRAAGATGHAAGRERNFLTDHLSGCQSCPGKHRSVSAVPRRAAGTTGFAAGRERNVLIDHLIYPAASRVLASTGASAQRPAASQVPLAALLEESVPLYHLPDPHCLPYRSSRGTSSPPPRAATAASSGSNLRKPLASRGGHRPEETAPPLPSSLAARPPLPSTSLSVKGPRPRTPRRDPIVGGIRPGHAGLPDSGCAAPRRRGHPRERLAGAGPPSCRSDVALWQLQAAEACGGTVRRSRAEAR